MRKYFTVKDAEKEIPRIKKILLKLRDIKREIDAIVSVNIDVDKINFDEFLETNNKLNKEYHKLSYEFYSEVEKLDELGCVLKDIELGLVDFYCKFNDKDVFLCWKLEEDRIIAWHEIDSGYGGRKPILKLED